MRKVCVFLFFSLFSAVAMAENSQPIGVQIGVGLSGTGGLNIFAGYHTSKWKPVWLQYFGARIDFAGSKPLKSAIDSAIEHFMRDGIDVGDGVRIDDGTLDVWNSSLLLDFYPFAGAWRITGGYSLGNMNLKTAIYGTVLDAPSQRFYFYLAGDHYYYNGNNFDGLTDITWRYNGPYIGTGFDFDLFCGFSLYTDIGMVFTNRSAKMSIDIPHEQLYIYDTVTNAWAPVTIPKLDSDVAEATREANQKLSKFKIYPMIKLGFAYRF
ncbi:MAG: hypothetical protein R8N24_02115 [Alphaproteobacteria bacterium]|nr:hypothetical protein [Alphaproteobacteria bacterium]